MRVRARSVLTDRAFLAEPKTMLWAFMLGGLIAGAFIILFGLLGVFGAAQAITNPSRHAPLPCLWESWILHALYIALFACWICWRGMVPCYRIEELPIEAW